MKKIQKLVSMLLAVAVCTLLPGIPSLTASAAEPVTYYLKYIDNQWRLQYGSQWNDELPHKELLYMELQIKDGDVIVIDGVGGTAINIPARLSNLTFCQGASAVVTAKAIDTCYVLGGSLAAINGDVTTAYVYDNASCTFNNNVDTLQILVGPNQTNLLKATVTVGGTVNHLIGKDNNVTHYEYYSFTSGKFSVKEGTLLTDSAFYNRTPGAITTPPATDSSDDEYDDVPKTGDTSTVLWLFGIATICLAGRYTLKKCV